MTARLAVEYGFSSSKVFDQNYTLYLDRTPPTLQIVSPESGDYVPIGERTDVLLKSFDKYGIEKVEVSKNGGAYETLADPNKYSFTASIDDYGTGVVISAIATDPNGNVSPPATITLYPFDPEQGAPKLEIISPENGSTFQEGQSVNFEIQMRNIPDAKLFLDVGGVEAPEESGILIQMPEYGSERQFVSATIPSVAEDIVVLARIQKGNVKAYKFLNVVNDEGIDETADVSLLPKSSIFTGTQLSVASNIPNAMRDFNTESFIRVSDPVGSATPVDIQMGKSQRVEIGTQGSNVSVQSVLKDLSGNERTGDTVLSKISYFSSLASSTAISALHASEEIADIVYLDGYVGNQALVVAFNDRNGGYRLQAGVTTLGQGSKGKVLSLFNTGTGVAAQIQTQGQNELLFYPLQSGVLGSELRYNINAQLVGVSGDLAWMKQGNFILAAYINSNNLLPLAGMPLNEPVLHQEVVAGKLYVLTSSGMYRFGIALDTVPAVKQEWFVALPDQLGFVTDGMTLTTWSESEITIQGILSDDSLLNRHKIQVVSNIDITHARLDGEISWLRAVDDVNQRIEWQAYLNGELVALHSDQSEKLVFTSRALYSLAIANGLEAVSKREINVESGATSLVSTTEMNQFGITVSLSVDAETLGYSTIYFQQAGVLLPATEIVRDAERKWFIPYDVIDNSEITVVYQDHAIQLTDSFTPSVVM
jgi:hypothetical protein